MIPIITIDEHNRPIEHRVIKAPRARGRAVKLTLAMSIGDQIFIRPDWPAIGSPDFAERLRAWHEQHNQTAAAVCPACGTLETEREHDPMCPLFYVPMP